MRQALTRSACRLPVRLGSASSAIHRRERSSWGASSYSTGPSCRGRAQHLGLVAWHVSLAILLGY